MGECAEYSLASDFAMLTMECALEQAHETILLIIWAIVAAISIVGAIVNSMFCTDSGETSMNILIVGFGFPVIGLIFAVVAPIALLLLGVKKMHSGLQKLGKWIKQKN